MFYQPRRIVVCVKDKERSYSTYAVYIINTSVKASDDGFIENTWSFYRPVKGYWAESYKYGYSFATSSRAEAMEIAKSQAQNLSLPFHTTTDYWTSYRELRQVTAQTCAICDEDVGYQPDSRVVCEVCNLDAARGKMVEAERETFAILPTCLLPITFGPGQPKLASVHERSKHLYDALVALVQDTVHTWEQRHRKKQPDDRTLRAEHGGGCSQERVMMTAEQFEAMRQLVVVVSKAVSDSYHLGHKAGASNVDRLVTEVKKIGEFINERISE
jgi:hypothetical protein